MACAVPATARSVGSCRASILARMASTGSTPTTVAPVVASSAVNLPVPAPTSATSRPGPKPKACASQADSATG